jgi:hypothetical protein
VPLTTLVAIVPRRVSIEEAKTKQETCGEYLRLTLRDGPAEVRVVKAELGKAGFSTRTVERAARSLGVELRRAAECGVRPARTALPFQSGITKPPPPPPSAGT